MSKNKPIVPVSAREELASVTSEIQDAKEKTLTQKIWDDIRNVKLNMFSLNNQFVHGYYKPLFVEPNRLYLVGATTATAALPALEEAISPRYQVEQAERFVIVSLAPVK
jgi:hypothetical protein